MNCPKCQTEIPDKFKFCPECGTSVSAISDDSVQEGYPSFGDRPTAMKPGPDDPSIGDMPTMAGPHDDRSEGDIPTMIHATGSTSSGGRGQPLAARYELLEEIGRGGFAKVWRARDKKLDCIRAVKRLLDDKLEGAAGRQTLMRFEREATAIAQLNHLNIVMVYDHDKDAEGHYVVMEYVDGGTLRDHMKASGGKLPPVEAVRLTKGIAQGLAYAHRKNLVHRDIKPTNILLRKESNELVPKIVDFGLARMGSESEVSMTGYGMGTPNYMPPEQRRNAKGVNHTADIYALGKTLYEMISGEVPDQVDPEKVPPHLSRIILKCVKNNPEERYFSMEDLIADMDRAPTGGAGRTEVHAHQEDLACPSCGMINPENARFCEGCGQGLFRRCPECERDNRFNVRFCSGCGTSIPDMVKLLEVSEKMKHHMSDAAYSRVVKEFNQLPPKPELKGKKGSALWQATVEMKDRAESSLARLKDLKDGITGSTQAGEYKQALAMLDEMKKLDPDLADYDARREALTRDIEKQQWEKAFDEAAHCELKQAIVEGLAAIKSYLDAYPDGVFAREAGQRLAELKLARRDQLWRQAVEAADNAVAANEFQSAAMVYQVFVRDNPDHPQCATATQRMENLAEQHIEQRDEETWNVVYQAAMALADKRQAAGAIEHVIKFLKQHPNSTRADKARQALVEFRKRRRAEIWALRRKRLLQFSGIVLIVLIAFSSVQLRRKFWTNRFSNALASRDIAAATHAAAALPRGITEERLKWLAAYTAGRERIVPVLDQSRDFLARYESRQLEELDQMMERAQTTPDLQEALGLQAEVERRLGVFQQRFAGIMQLERDVLASFEKLEKRDAAFLIPGLWGSLEGMMNHARAQRNLADVESSYKKLQGVLPTAEKELERVEEEQRSLIALGQSVNEAVRAAKSDRMAVHARVDLDRLEQRLPGKPVVETQPEQFAELRRRLEVAQAGIADIRRTLEAASGRHAFFSQLERSLAPDGEWLASNIPESWARYRESIEALEASDELQSYRDQLEQVIRQADALTMEADRLKKETTP